MTLAVIRGLLVGIAVVIAVATLVSLGATVHGWPEGGGPTARARHLAEGISTGMHVASLASLVVVPGAIL